MSFLSTIISTFFTNYITMIIIRYLPIRKKQIVTGSVVSVVNIGSIIFYIYLMIASGGGLTENIYLIAECVGIFIGYIASMMMIFDGVQIFKSKRYREFERNLKQKKTNPLPTLVSGIVFILLGVVMGVFVGILFFDKSKLNIFNMVCLAIGMVASIALGIVLLCQKKQDKGKKETVMFVIDYEEHKLVYLQNLEKTQRLTDFLGKINDSYISDDYGYIITKESSIHVFGIKVTQLDEDAILSIQMKRINSSRFKPALEKMSKYNRQRIYMDENYAIVKVTAIK